MSAFTYNTAPEGNITPLNAMKGLLLETKFIDRMTHSHNLVGLYLNSLSKAGFTEEHLADVSQYFGITEEGLGGGWTQYAPEKITGVRHPWFSRFLEEATDENGEIYKTWREKFVERLVNNFECDEEDLEEEDDYGLYDILSGYIYPDEMTA